ncbi:6,7-dimethyl-8-ribityllumazine synthase [Halocola ammonii]
MATENKNLSEYKLDETPSAAGLKFGIAVSEWNREITSSLLDGALETLRKHGVEERHLKIIWVPGSFELTSAAQFLLENTDLNAVITLGSVIRGETSHFDFVCQAVSQGVKDVALKYRRPVIFGVLTDDNMDQAKARSGGKHGNKGIECAVAAIKMAHLQKQLRDTWGPGFNF